MATVQSSEYRTIDRSIEIRCFEIDGWPGEGRRNLIARSGTGLVMRWPIERRGMERSRLDERSVGEQENDANDKRPKKGESPSNTRTTEDSLDRIRQCRTQTRWIDHFLVCRRTNWSTSSAALTTIVRLEKQNKSDRGVSSSERWSSELGNCKWLQYL